MINNNMLTITKAEIVSGTFASWWAWYLKIPAYQTIFPATIGAIKGIKHMMEYQKSRNNIFTFLRHLKHYAEKKDFKLSGLMFVASELIVWAIDINFNINNLWYVLPFVASMPLDVLARYLYLEHYNDLIVKRLEKRYKDNIVYIDNIAGKLTLKSFNPLDINNTKELELCTNTTITSIKQDLMRKQVYLIKHGKGIEVEYRKMPKCSEQRLTSILKSYGDNPILVKQEYTEADTRIIYMSKLGVKRINKLIEDIEHKLGTVKDGLTINYEEGKVVFCIKTTENKQYYIDNIIPYTKREKTKVPYVIGVKRTTGKAFKFDLIKTGHSLIGGMTGSGKSSTLHSILQSIMYWNDDVFFFMVDLKGNELPDVYGEFLNCSVVGLADGDTLQDSLLLIKDMFIKVDEEYNKRIRLFKEKGVKDIAGYNSKYGKLPYILFVIDEANAIFETIQKKNKEVFALIESVQDNLFARGRSTGIYNLHTMQQIRDGDYCISWRRAMMTRICMKMKEAKQCQMVLECTTEIADKASKQTIGEFILSDYNSNNHELQNIRVDDDKKDITYNKLLAKFGGVKNVDLEKSVEEN